MSTRSVLVWNQAKRNALYYTLSVLSWNIGQANREELHPETSWNNRTTAVKALIKRVAADIVCLVELRALKTSNETPEQFIAAFPEYAAISRPYNHYHDCFTMAVLYKHEKLFARDTRVVVLGENPMTSRLLMLTDFTRKDTGEQFTVGVTHFDLPEDVKWRSVETVAAALNAQPLPTFIYGDFNFFDDRDGAKQRARMLECAVDIAAPLPHGTFVGFPHDEFKKAPGEYSRLDHIFARGITAAPPRVPFIEDYQLDNGSYATYTYPSDHLAIAVDITIA